MLKVIAHTTTEYRFADEAEEKIKEYAKRQGMNYIDAVYDLIDMGELDLELDSGYENTDELEITEVDEIIKTFPKTL